MSKKPKFKKREWVYSQSPKIYELSCGNDESHEIEWSEWEGHVWCPVCKEDQESSMQGIFSGPIMLGTCEILGVRFDRFWLKSEEVEIFDIDHCIEEDKSRFISVEKYQKYLVERKAFLENQIK